MKDLITKPSGFTRIEFWAVTTIFVFVVFFFLSDALDNISKSTGPNKYLFDDADLPFDIYSNYFIPVLTRYISLYLAFGLLNFLIVPKLVAREANFKHVFLTLLVVVSGAIAFGISDMHYKAYLYQGKPHDAINLSIWEDSFLYSLWLLFLFAVYSAIKYAGVYLLSHSEAIHSKYRFITREGIAALLGWVLIMFILLIEATNDIEIIAIWAIVAPSAILLYGYSFYSLLPKSLARKHPRLSYMLSVLLVLVISMLPVFFLGLIITEQEDVATGISFFNLAVQVFIIAPLTWILFKRHIKGNQELYTLKKELGRSNANLDFLRSQINPHFLFNALNTIYGTAIQEKAERTSEAIEKLGDMMRFMLQENMQEKISIVREIDYLNNYIGLQKLRTGANPAIQIQTDIQDPESACQIAPMLLIPFVENAFKHGISFREPSHIKLSLEIKNNTLYFDVDNSKHPRQETDPEKDNSGIGLENVKQRLKLLYPGRHDLIIRETDKVFFVHLTIQLA